MTDRPQGTLSRRALLLASVGFCFTSSSGFAGTIAGALPWVPNAGSPMDPVEPGPWVFFTPLEGSIMEALADRVIPPDPETPGGKGSGCAVFVDRQLAGPYGAQDGLYLRPPFMKGATNQGPQSQGGPRQQYREGLAALDRASRTKFSGKAFVDLSASEQDDFLCGIEKGDVQLDGADGEVFFATVIRDVQMGFFADPIYGGNKDMAAWKMIGYPGARYNYLDWVNRHNERFPLPPVGMTGNIDWTPKKKA